MPFSEKRYYSLDSYIKQTFGEKLYKLALNGGMSCPNRDGTLGRGGCIFCSKGGSGDFAADQKLSISEQIQNAKELVSKKQLKLINKYNQKQRKLNKNFKESKYYIDSNEYYLKNRRDQYYPIKTNLNEDTLIILNCEELCLIDGIDYLKSIGISSFSI